MLQFFGVPPGGSVVSWFFFVFVFAALVGSHFFRIFFALFFAFFAFFCVFFACFFFIFCVFLAAQNIAMG